MDQDDLISVNEHSLMTFLVKQGGQIFKEYFKELVNVPNRDVVDEYIEILYNFIFCFIDTTATAGRKDDGPSLYKKIKKANSIRDVESDLANCDDLSITWLAQCLFEVPMTIYTDEDKTTLLQRIAGVSQRLADEQVELSKQAKTNQFLQKKLDEELDFLKEELYLIYKRARNYSRRT